MRIINPLYDQAFKYLMDNNQIAKKILSLVLEKNIVSLQSKPQEIKTIDPKRNIPLSRFDFKAIIEDENKKHINVLIEIQKSNNPDPVIRFRRYLGKNYIRQETFIDANGKENTNPLPIITIYFLGYNLPDYDTPAIVVNNIVKDAVNNCIIEHKDTFVQLLTHPSYILQINRLKKERKTRIEKFLAIFDQKNVGSEKYILDINEQSDDEDIENIKKYLNRATEDEDMLLKLELEEDVEREFDALEKSLEKERAEKEKERAEKEEALKREAEAKQKELETLSKLHKSIKLFFSKGFSVEEISDSMDISIEEVKDILGL
jgi:hypothetical protein